MFHYRFLSSANSFVICFISFNTSGPFLDSFLKMMLGNLSGYHPCDFSTQEDSIIAKSVNSLLQFARDILETSGKLIVYLGSRKIGKIVGSRPSNYLIQLTHGTYL